MATHCDSGHARYRKLIMFLFSVTRLDAIIVACSRLVLSENNGLINDGGEAGGRRGYLHSLVGHDDRYNNVCL